MPNRAQYREAIGRRIGRSYYAKSTTHASVACTTTTIVDTVRTEEADYWNGASLLVAGNERLVNGSMPTQDSIANATLYLNAALPTAPGLGVPYELLKGYTFADVHEGIARAHTLSYPYLYDTETTLVNETADAENIVASASGNWRNVSEVRRKDIGSTRYRDLREKYDYQWRVDQGQWLYLPLYTSEVGASLQFIADVPLTFTPSDDTTVSFADIDLIVEGALWWLYDKGANPDEGSLQDRWTREADKAATRFEYLKHQFAMPKRGSGKVVRPAVHVVNTGYMDRYNGE